MAFIQLFVSNGNETISIKSEIDKTISSVKKTIVEKLQWNRYEDFRLVSSLGKSLNNDMTLQFYSQQQIIQDHCTLNLLINLNGGKKKRKKKKIHLRVATMDHKHRNIPLAPLSMKYYEYNASIGSMCCNRMNCPRCGIGCLMANHDDRHYCGKCHLVLYFEKTTTKLSN